MLQISLLRWNWDLVSYITSVEKISDYTFSGCIKTIADFGYEKVKVVGNPGEFSIKGDIVSLWVPGAEEPVRMSYFGDSLEEICFYDALTGRALNCLQHLDLFDLHQLNSRSDWENIQYIKLNSTSKGSLGNTEEVIVLLQSSDSELYQDKLSQEKVEFEVSKFDFAQPAIYFRNFGLVELDINNYSSQDYRVWINSKHGSELPTSLKKYLTKPAGLEQELQLSHLENLDAGFKSTSLKTLIITDRELFGTIFVSTRRKHQLKSTEAQKLLQQLEGEIEIGNYIVHIDYGVGIYKGFVVENGQDYLRISYAAEDELLVPMQQIDKLTKYISESGQEPQITRLGRTDWENVKKFARKQVEIAAKELAQHYAHISLATAVPAFGEDSNSYSEFVDKFAYTPTPDQLKAEREIIKDISKKTPMHRLLIGDVGYGKTEIIMRAAYKICEAEAQVIVLCPTTILALQHYRSFQERFKDTPFNICMLSRFNTPEQSKAIVSDVKLGKYDIIIGTHKLLSNSLELKKLGLLVVDEEQRFGVKQKEKLRKLEFGVHTLYVSATPIPRTLSMALSAIQDITIIQTPPPGRKAVITEVSQLSWQKIQEALTAELARQGQVYFVHNEIKTIYSVAKQLQNLLPECRFVVAHGQMSSAKLDQIMTEFYERKYDVLISTTIIENGLDMPNVNTIIVNNAQKLGLAQMYQLRGRVGRSFAQAYAYFFYQGSKLQAQEELAEIDFENPDLAKSEKPNRKYLERLETILNAQELGSGFLIASRDLEIRGAGNLLGAEQHGTISKVGYGLYMQMLAEEIEKLKVVES